MTLAGISTSRTPSSEVPLGTLAVRDYLATSAATCAPELNFELSGRGTSRPSVRAIATAPCCSSRRKASCRCSRP